MRIFENLIHRKNYLPHRAGYDVDNSLRYILRTAIDHIDLQPMELIILREMNIELLRIQNRSYAVKDVIDLLPGRVMNFEERLGLIQPAPPLSLNESSERSKKNARLFYQRIADGYEGRFLDNRAFEKISSSDIDFIAAVALQDECAKKQNRYQSITISVLKLIQCILFNNDYPHPSCTVVEPVPELDKYASVTISEFDRVSEPRRQFYNRLIFARAIRNVVLHLNLKTEDARFLYYALSVFERPADRRFVKNYVIDAVDFESIKSSYLGCEAFNYRISKEKLDEAESGNIGPIMELSLCIMVENIDRYKQVDFDVGTLKCSFWGYD